MAFQRARTDEQRAQRRRQILDGAAAMLTEMPVARLSLNELSRRIGLAKANVLRYFESREAVLLVLLDAEVGDWIAALQSTEPPTEGTPRERGDRLAELLAASLAARPVLCDLLSAQAAVLEHNISSDVAVEHKLAARESLAGLVRFVALHLPELGDDGAAVLVETTLLMATTAWPCSRPSEAVRSAYAADSRLAGMRIDFTDLMSRTTAVTASGILARQDTAY